MRYIAFLRAINVGGRTVKMDHLRQLFADLGFAGAQTFIASGNVIFETRAKNAAALEIRIAAGLYQALGFEVATFIRTATELDAIAACRPFAQADLEAAPALNIAFLGAAPGEGARRKLLALRTEIDDFVLDGREVYWLCRRKQSESTFSNAVLERTLGQPATLRGVNTVQKLAAQYASPAE